MCGNDLMAVGCLRAADDLGFVVPLDLRVTGFDHVPWAELVRPRLTTMEVPASQIGYEAARQIFEHTSRNRTLISCQLVKGESC